MGCLLKGIGITFIICLIIVTVDSCNDRQNLNKLESYINAKDYVKAEELIKKLDIKEFTGEDQQRFLELELKTFTAVRKYDDAAKSIIAYYENLEYKSTLDEALKQKLNDIKSKTSLETSKRIDSIFADIAQIKLEKQQEEAAAKSKEMAEKSKDFENSYRDIVNSRDGDKIATLYNSGLNDNEKSTLAKATDKSYVEWLISEVSKMKYSDEYNIEKIDQQLNFLTKVDGLEFNRLKNVEVQIKELVALRCNENLISQKYGNNVQIINNSVQSLDIYVVSRIQSPYHINVAGIDLTKKYTDQYQIASYRYAGGTAYPTNDWMGVMAFKDSSSVYSGVKNILAMYTKDESFFDIQGFEKKLPVYIEVTQNDINYSNEINKNNVEEDKVVENINKILQ